MRLLFFAVILVLLAVIEAIYPRRKVDARRVNRWPSNIGIVFLDNLIARILLPVTTIAVALYASDNQIGLFNLVSTGYVLTIIVSMLLLDVLIYLQHVVFHKVSWLWRFHRMHHSDTHLDVTTGIRFHPVEIILSLIIKFTAILVFGIPAMAVLLFEIVLNATAMITHSNINLPAWLDRFLRWMFVTPDMHRVHHSILRRETDSNYGFNLSVWDRFFGTYIEQPRDGHVEMQIGIKHFRDHKEQRIDKMLTQPFRDSD